MKRILSAIAATLVMTSAHAAWPDQTVTMVVPFPPGGSTDMIGRLLASKLEAQLGQTFVVDNKAGATGTIGAAHVARAKPDGNTLLVASLGPYVIAPHLFSQVPYDALKDFDYLTVAVQAPNVLVVPETSPHKSVADVIAFEKANPGVMTFATSGTGSSDHLTAELFWRQTDTSGVHVPYKGGGPVLAALLGSQVDASFMNINTAIPQIKSGKLKALAITSAQRSALLPDVPTLTESGVQDANVYSWQAVAAPKGLPADVKAKLHAALIKGLNDPDVKTKLLDLGFEIVGNTPEEFTKFQADEFNRWKTLIEARKISAN